MSVRINPQQRFQVLTPNGWEPFTAVQKLAKPMMVEICFEGSAPSIRCSPLHRFRDTLGALILAQDLVGGEPLQHQDLGAAIVRSVTPVPGPVALYDVLDAGRDKLFYTNGLVSHNCEFLGSSDTLISGDRLKKMTWNAPVMTKTLRFDDTYRLDIHVPPLEHHNYVLCADVAKGIEQDASALVVIDISIVPYRLVAKYRSNIIRPMLFADVIFEVATMYNSAMVLVETNDLGSETAKTLYQDLEYEYLISTVTKGKTGPVVGGGFSRNTEFGLRHNRSSKRQGCVTLKTMIETEKLLAEDLEVYTELTRFVLNNRGSYSAEGDGSHDDLVMCLVNFAWLVTQQYFKDLTNTDVYTKLKEDYRAQIEDDVPLFGYISSSDVVWEEDDGLIL